MESLNDILRDATEAITSPYFRLPIDGGESVYRERVYCYELYHQMRSRWPADCPYCLNGEVDKAGHPLLGPLGVGRKKPDLLVHGPGHMELNHAIFEVKAQGADDDGTLKDLETLTCFTSAVGYRRAFYLIYGADAEATIECIRRVARAMPHVAPIEVWTHVHVGQGAARACVLP